MDLIRYGLASEKEIELFNLVKSIDDRAISTYRDGKHLDIYIPQLRIGFEFNGVYWHSEAKKDSNYHTKKVQHFHERQIRYVQFWEDDFDNRINVITRFIKNLLGKNTRLGARKTRLLELSQQEFDQFMNENHMQGTVRCKIRLGLEFDGQIVSAMGFKDIPRNVKKLANGNGIELVRFANTNVTGAFSKLLKHIETQYDYSYVTSFGDLEIIDQTSNVYLKNGFHESYRIKPDYRYYNYRTHMREHKFKWRKDKFKSLGIDINGKTEHQMALEHKLLRCYDSGKILYLKVFNR